jgi:ElaB/YqjD/DUF883 family membrane-anchored ribosome-binding protein
MESLNLQDTQDDKTKGQNAGLNLVPPSPNRGETGSASTGGTATAAAKSLYDQAKETAGQAYGAATDRAAQKLDEQKSTVSDGLTAVADSVRQVGSNLESSRMDSGVAEAAAKYTNRAAGMIEDVASYFEEKGVREMARDLENFARRNPAIFIGAAFGLGFLAARFLKSTSADSFRTSAGRDFASAENNRRSSKASASLDSGAGFDDDDVRTSPV